MRKLNGKRNVGERLCLFLIILKRSSLTLKPPVT